MFLDNHGYLAAYDCSENHLEAPRMVSRNQMMVPVLLEISTVSGLASIV
jgi:hypothetical protein